VSRSRILQLGVSGLGPDWDAIYAPSLERLKERVRLVAAEHPVVETGTEWARLLGAKSLHGVRALLAHDDLDGLLLLGADWRGLFPLEAAIEGHQNTYVVLPARLNVARLGELSRRASTQSSVAMPELRLRYTPATLRLRELLATELGPIQRIDICSRSRIPAPPTSVQMQLFDWCIAVLGGWPRSVECRLAADPKGMHARMIKLHFLRNGHDIAVDVRLPQNGVQQARECMPPAAADEWPVECTLRCRYGEARLEDAMHLRWRCSGRERVESLATDRTATAVAIDHFARRLAGGLVPVPNLEDVVSSLKLVQFAEQSLSQGTAVKCSPGS
jgi:predicted dehydrogenase